MRITILTVLFGILMSTVVFAGMGDGIDGRKQQISEQQIEDSSVTAEEVQLVVKAIVEGVTLKQGTMIFWEKCPDVRYDSSDIHESGYQTVIVIDSNYYTIYVSNTTGKPDTTNLDWISFWWRPVGTDVLEELITWTDHDFNGLVEFGQSRYYGFYDEERAPYDFLQKKYQVLHNEAIRNLFDAFYSSPLAQKSGGFGKIIR